MISRKNTNSNRVFPLKRLTVALAVNALAISVSHAAPTGGNVVGGSGSINHSGNQTQINQNTDRLAIDWDTFDVDRNEQVRFVQPSTEATALNRILDHNPSAIHGRIDANGRVILMNPNGLLFGGDSRVNVQSLVASGLDISADDFMNGELALQGVDGTEGRVANHGLIRAATGGNVLLVGKKVENTSVIEARLGHVGLVSGNAAVATFDEQGMIGVRVDEAALEDDVNEYPSNNRGEIHASGGKILLSASTGQDLFSAAVNHGALDDEVEAVVHDDGSFTIGGGHAARNLGVLDASTQDGSAGGDVIMTGSEVRHQGGITASAKAGGPAGSVQMYATEEVQLTAGARINANSEDSASGLLVLAAGQLHAETDAAMYTTGDAILASCCDSRLPTIGAHNALIETLGEVSQSGPINLSGELHIHSGPGATLQLTHQDNDFNSLSVAQFGSSPSHIVDRNDLIIGDIHLEESDLRVEALSDDATLTQAANSEIRLWGSDLRLEGAHLELGINGSNTQTWGSNLRLDFRHSVDTGDSIRLFGDGSQASYAEINGSSGTVAQVQLTQSTSVAESESGQPIDASIDTGSGGAASGPVNIARMEGENARFERTRTELTQSGPIKLSDTLYWHGTSAELSHPENDVAYLEAQGGSLGQLRYNDSNDLTLKDIRLESETSLDVSVAGEGSTLRQAPNTALYAPSFTLRGDNILLGADGTSSANAYYGMTLELGSLLVINGEFSTSGSFYAPGLSIRGDEADNVFIYGEHANSRPFGSLEDADIPRLSIELGAGDDVALFEQAMIVEYGGQLGELGIDLGSGNDWIHLDDDVYPPITLGDGSDDVTDLAPGQYHTLTDFNPTEDVYEMVDPL